ncbi:MAG: His-Xaa-Ser system protein HxsD [Gemmatimonadaceae bacterium]
MSLTLYTQEALFRACHRFTERCHVTLSPAIGDEVLVHFAAKPGASLGDIRGEFANELIDQRVRYDLERATRHIRNRIVDQTFGEADIDRVRR